MPTKIRAILFFGSLLAAARGAGVTNVAGAALATPDECTSLSAVTIPDSLTSISNVRITARHANTRYPACACDPF